MSPNFDATSLPNFVSTREDAWRHLGMTLPGATTAEEAMKFGRLSGWNVRKAPLLAQVGNRTITVPDQYALVRDNPVVDNQVDVLGTGGKDYRVIQNEEHAGLLDLLVEESGATYETAGELFGGKQAFVTLKLPGHAKVGGVDKVDNYITAMPSHDGEVSTRLMVTPVRVSSQATLNMAFKGVSYTHKVQHTSQAHKHLAQQAKEALEFTFNYLDAFQEEADRLVNTPLSQSKFEALLERNFGAPKGAAANTLTRAQNKLDHMAELFADAFSVEGIRGTAWAGLNALAEWHDHFSPVRAGESSDADVRSIKAVLYPTFKNKALKMLAVA